MSKKGWILTVIAIMVSLCFLTYTKEEAQEVNDKVEVNVTVESKRVSEKNEIERALQAYEEFITGKRCIEDINIISFATPTGEPERRRATDYIVLDVNGDGIPELNIDCGHDFIVISYENDELYILQSYWLDPLVREILEDGTLVSYNYKHGDAWCFYQLDREGNEINELYFSRVIHQRKENGRYIDEYTYEFDGKPCTEEEWYAKTREYLYTDENGWEQVLNAVEWTRYCEAK